jgi:hypothetical protein
MSYRLKMKVASVTPVASHNAANPAIKTVQARDVIEMNVVAVDGAASENSNYAKLTVSGSLQITSSDPALVSTVRAGQYYYVDLTLTS